MVGPAQCMHGAPDGWPCAVHAWSPGWLALRSACMEPRMVGPAQCMHGAPDGWPYIYKMCADL